jgi:hypothetical protein
MILVPLFDLKLLAEFASNPRHEGATGGILPRRRIS